MTDAPKIEGGFDGLVLSFGDGCTIDTINALLPAWRVEFTLRNGDKVEGEVVGAGTADDGWALVEYHPVDEADEPIYDRIESVLFDDVVGIHIY